MYLLNNSIVLNSRPRFPARQDYSFLDLPGDATEKGLISAYFPNHRIFGHFLFVTWCECLTNARLCVVLPLLWTALFKNNSFPGIYSARSIYRHQSEKNLRHITRHPHISPCLDRLSTPNKTASDIYIFGLLVHMGYKRLSLSQPLTWCFNFVNAF